MVAGFVFCRWLSVATVPVFEPHLCGSASWDPLRWPLHKSSPPHPTHTLPGGGGGSRRSGRGSSSGRGPQAAAG